MSLFSLPPGSTITITGRVLTEREAMHPVHFADPNGDQHGPEIFSAWSLAELNSIGVKAFIEDAIPQDYDPGTPVDVETSSEIHRTYPNATLNSAKAAARANAAILAQIAVLEAMQTPRLLREALKKKTCVVNKPGTIIHGLTPEAAVDAIDAQVETLRAQITGAVYYQAPGN